jgi:hypothetical protein
MKFFTLDKGWKVWIYRWGLLLTALSLIGWIFIANNEIYGEDILKKKKNPKFNSLIEKRIYVLGWLSLIGFTFALTYTLISDYLFTYVLHS